MPVREDLSLEMLRSIRHGDLVSELSEEIAEVVRGAEDSGKEGKIVLTIKVKPNGRGQMVLRDEIKSTVPKLDAPAVLMFNDVHGNLSRKDPNQPDLPMRGVSEEPDREVKMRDENHG